MKTLHLFFIFLILCSSIILETKQTQASAAMIAAVAASSTAAASHRRQVEQKELEEANKVKAMCVPPYWFGEENNCSINYAYPRDPLNFVCTKQGEKYDIVAGCDGSIMKSTYHNLVLEQQQADAAAKPVMMVFIIISGTIIVAFVLGSIFRR